MSAVLQDAPGSKDRRPDVAPVEWIEMQRDEADPITVLLVDDDDQLRGICRSYLEENGFRVLEAENGLEALLATAQRRGAIDLLMTDVVMPGISGVDLGLAFREIFPSVNVLYMSGSPREAVGKELPADCAFLAKPFAPHALVNVIGRVLGRSHKV